MDLIEIDRLVAEKVMGFEVTRDGERIQNGKRFGIPSYSQKIQHAWKVIEKLGDECGVCISNQGGWGCLIYDLDTETSYTATGTSTTSNLFSSIKSCWSGGRGMKPIEKYECQDCNYQWGIGYATFKPPSCPICEENLNVVETTDTDRSMIDKERLKKIRREVNRSDGDFWSFDTNDIAWLISTVEGQNYELEHRGKIIEELYQSETFLIKIRELLADYEFQSGVLENAVAEPEGIYYMVVEFRKMFEEQKKNTADLAKQNKRYREAIENALEELIGNLSISDETAEAMGISSE